MYCLQSASFGRGFLGPDVRPDVVDQFVETAQQLRVLNNVRNEQIGIPVTLRQYPPSSWIRLRHGSKQCCLYLSRAT